MMLHLRFRIGALVCLLAAISSAIAVAGPPSSQRITPLVRAIQRVRPAVVNIHSQKHVISASGFASNSNKMSGMGTGVVIDERGYIVTNYHVIEEVSSIRVTLVDGASYAARVIARDPETDLALLKIDPNTSLQVMPMGSSEDLMHGETVVAIGNAFGYEHTVTKGIISELHRDVRLSAEQSYRDLIQTDASINPGNSGGPLINADGEMIGLNVAIRAGAQGIGFAIPVDEVKRVVAKLLNLRTLNNTWHGMICVPVSLADARPGRLVIQQVEPVSPAEKAGVQPGDRILVVGNLAVQNLYDVERALLDKRPGEQVLVVCERGGKEVRLPLVVQAVAAGDASRDLVWRRLGLRLSEDVAITDVRRVSSQLNGGIRILEVAPESAAHRAGMLPGDVLVGLDDRETLNLENILFVINKRDGGQSLLRFYVVRSGQIHRGWLQL